MEPERHTHTHRATWGLTSRLRYRPACLSPAPRVWAPAFRHRGKSSVFPMPVGPAGSGEVRSVGHGPDFGVKQNEKVMACPALSVGTRYFAKLPSVRPACTRRCVMHTCGGDQADLNATASTSVVTQLHPVRGGGLAGCDTERPAPGSSALRDGGIGLAFAEPEGPLKRLPPNGGAAAPPNGEFQPSHLERHNPGLQPGPVRFFHF